MPDNKAKPQQSQEGPGNARKKPDAAKNEASDAREDRLAEALRANLRRRKQGGERVEKKDN